MTSPWLRPLSIGEILDGGFTIFRQHFTQFLTVGALLLGLPTVFGVAASLAGNGEVGLALLIAWWLTQFVASYSLIGASVWITSEVVHGRPVDVRAALAKGLRKFFPIFLCVMLVALVATIGLCFLIVPGVILWLVCFATVPVLVIEDRWDFFRRSPELARGSWGKILLVTILYTIIVALPSILLGVGSFLRQQQMAALSSDPTLLPAMWEVLAGTVVGALTTPFANSCLTLLYYDQRVRKEGLDVELSAAAIGAAPR